MVILRSGQYKRLYSNKLHSSKINGSNMIEISFGYFIVVFINLKCILLEVAGEVI